MWACFSNRDLEPETLQACIAEAELQAQIRILKAILEAHRHKLSEEIKKTLLEALEEAETILDTMTKDPVVEKIRAKEPPLNLKHRIKC